MAGRDYDQDLRVVYTAIRDPNDRPDYQVYIDPVVAAMGDEEARRFGEQLWQEREEWLATHEPNELFPFTGFAFHLATPAGGS